MDVEDLEEGLATFAGNSTEETGGLLLVLCRWVSGRPPLLISPSPRFSCSEWALRAEAGLPGSADTTLGLQTFHHRAACETHPSGSPVRGAAGGFRGRAGNPQPERQVHQSLLFESRIYIRDIFVLLLFTRSVLSDSLWPHGLQHTRPPCPFSSPGDHPSSFPLNQWCYPNTSSSALPSSPLPAILPSIMVFSNEGGQTTGVGLKTDFPLKFLANTSNLKNYFKKWDTSQETKAGNDEVKKIYI